MIACGCNIFVLMIYRHRIDKKIKDVLEAVKKQTLNNDDYGRIL